LELYDFDKIFICVKGEYKPIQPCPLDVFFFIESTQFVYIIVYTLAILIWGKTLSFNCLRETLKLWCWCWKNFWVWHFLRTLQIDSPFALY